MESPIIPAESGSAAAVRPPIPRLAVASLVLGIVGLATSFLLLGAIPALVGVVLGGIHLRQRSDARLMGWSGVWLSLLALVAAGCFLVLYAVGLRQLTQFHQPSRGLEGAAGFASWKGKEAPDFEIATVDGDRMRLSDFKGRRVVIDFWATWCPPCVQEIPHFIQLRKDYPEDALVIIGLSQEDRAVLKPFKTGKGINYPVASTAGGDLPEPFSRVHSIPTTFFLDSAGRIEEVVVGYHDYEALRRCATGPGLPAGVRKDTELEQKGELK